MSQKPRCFGKEITILGINGYICRKHDNCLFQEECCKLLVKILYESGFPDMKPNKGGTPS